MEKKKIVTLGAGFGGLTVAFKLEPLVKAKKVDIFLVEKSPDFRMGFSLQWVLAGRRKPDEGRRLYSSLRTKKINFIQDEAVSILADQKEILTKSRRLPYDYLIIALGAELAPETIPGLAEGAYNLCDFGSVLQFRQALENLQSGTVLIAIAATPFKCPPAPYEYAMLVDDIMRKRKIRGDIRIVLTTPEPQPLPVGGPAVGDAVKKMLAGKQIEYLNFWKPKQVNVGARQVEYENGEKMSYDLLAAMSPHRAPKVARESGLCSESGFIPAELGSFKTAAPGVYAIGDVAALKLPNGGPHPKAGVFAEAQGEAVASAIRAEITGAKPAPYSGRGACFVDVGGNEAVPAMGELLHPDGPRLVLNPPSRAGLLAKKKFERERLEKWFRV
jgi:sulfide:quinone oxidoreductase